MALFGIGRLLGALLLSAGLGSAAPPAAAQSLPEPRPPVILAVDGAIARTTADGTALFGRADLEALGITAIETATPWHEGVGRFEGVSLRRLLQHLGAAGTAVRVAALNDYEAVIPMADLERYDPILAFRKDGEYLRVRDKGPLFVIYPFDRWPELRNETVFSRSVWQVNRISVK